MLSRQPPESSVLTALGEADKIPTIPLKTRDRSKAANAQNDFVNDDFKFAKTFELAHECEEKLIAKFYVFTSSYKKLPTKPKQNTVEELETPCIISF